MSTLRDELEALLAEVHGVEVGGSAFSTGAGYWVNAKEIAHFDADNLVDLRLTRTEIRARRAELRQDDRVQLRKSTSSDWLEIRVMTPADVEFVVALAQVAAAAHLPAGNEPPKPAPSGPDLERRRRFH